jgi:hypothetical protein
MSTNIETEYPALAVGDKLKFAEEKQRYTVRSVSKDGRWAICTKPFNACNTVLYTILDLAEGERGVDNMVFSLGYEDQESIDENMRRLEAGEMELSLRHRPIDLRIEFDKSLIASTAN